MKKYLGENCHVILPLSSLANLKVFTELQTASYKRIKELPKGQTWQLY